ncbi:unnamed protein product [Coregonus sp. 'balchen']|nr:unnamed protein product [Coregonus sp. 'balchen']
MELDSMKYAELRSLAKEVGLKTSKLKEDETGIAAQDDINSTQEVNNSSQEVNYSSQDGEPSLKPPTQEFVTKRRGRGRPKKRKEPEDEEPVCLRSWLNPASAKGSAKRRRASAAKDSGVAALVEESQKTNVETQPEPGHKDAVTFEKDFRKLHEAHFKRMESIDSYVERKTKQIDLFRSSVKELKVLSDKTLSKPTEGNPPAISTPRCASLFSPASRRPATDKCRQSRVSAGKSAADKRRLSASKPATDKSRRTRATQDNEHKRSMVKTPARARMSPRVDLITPGKKETKVGGKREVNKTSVLSSTKTPGTAFVFNANASVLSNTPGTNKKANFDLKASLSKPLTYKPHRGKLKPFGETKENTAEQSQTVPSHQKNYKQHLVQTREERRTKQTEDRKRKKEEMLGARRGLVMT